jgi:hypothetical protein
LNISTASIGLAPRARLAIHIRFAPDPLKSRAELLPRHDGVNLDQRVLLGVEALVTVRKIEETHLRHRCIPNASSLSHDTEVRGMGQFIEVPNGKTSHAHSRYPAEVYHSGRFPHSLGPLRTFDLTWQSSLIDFRLQERIFSIRPPNCRPALKSEIGFQCSVNPALLL